MTDNPLVPVTEEASRRILDSSLEELVTALSLGGGGGAQLELLCNHQVTVEDFLTASSEDDDAWAILLCINAALSCEANCRWIRSNRHFQGPPADPNIWPHGVTLQNQLCGRGEYCEPVSCCWATAYLRGRQSILLGSSDVAVWNRVELALVEGGQYLEALGLILATAANLQDASELRWGIEDLLRELQLCQSSGTLWARVLATIDLNAFVPLLSRPISLRRNEMLAVLWRR